jgi:hypothetical protein
VKPPCRISGSRIAASRSPTQPPARSPRRWAGRAARSFTCRASSEIGERGSDTLISQDIKGSSDNVRFEFGNADRAMTALGNDTDLKYAAIDFCAYHVNSGIIIQIWKGVIQSFVSDGTPTFRCRARTGSSRS